VYVKWRGNAKRNLKEGTMRDEWKHKNRMEEIGGKWKGEKKSEMVKGGDGKTLTTLSIFFVWNTQLSWFYPKIIFIHIKCQHLFEVNLRLFEVIYNLVN